MYRTRLTVPIIAITLFALVISAFPRQTIGDVIEGTYSTMMPSANDSSFYRSSPDPTDPQNSYAIEVAEDSYLEKLYYTDDSIYVAQCSNFSNESGPYWAEEYATMPEDAEVLKVWLYAHFTYYRPDLSFRITANGSTDSLYVAGGIGGCYWNVTSLRDWDHDMLFNESTKVIILTYCDAGVSYFLGYVGYWFIQWYGYYDEEAEEGGEGDGGGDGGYEFEYDVIYTAEGLIGVLGLVGLIGMVGTPALGVWVMRNSDEGRINIFVKMLAMFMIFLTFFMVSVS